MSSYRLKHRRAIQKRHSGPASLNLVSLMDIFTILLVFLMVNSSEVEVLQTSTAIVLPDSTSEQRPENRIIVSVSQHDLVVQGRAVARVSDVPEAGTALIAGLEQELKYQAERKGEMPEGGHEITIMGDRELPYWLLKRIMMTCQATDFAKISLAVNQLPVAEPPAEPAVAAQGAAAPTAEAS